MDARSADLGLFGPGLSRRALLHGCLLAFAFGCGDDGPPAPDAAPVDIPVSEGEGVLLTRLAHWPTGGASLTVRLEDGDGWPLAGDRAGDLQFSWDDTGESQDITVRRAAPDPTSGHLLLLLVPESDAAAHDQMLAGVESFLRTRPAGERIALFRWQQTIDQLSNFTTDRDLLASVLQRVPTRPDGALLAPTNALQTAVFEARRVTHDEDRGLRSVVVVGSSLPEGVADSDGQSVLVQWAIDAPTAEDIERAGAGRLAAWQDHGGLAGALDEIATRMDAFRDAFYDIALCGVPLRGRVGMLTLAGEEARLVASLPGGPPEDRPAGEAPGAVPACVEQAILDGPRIYPEVIDFIFSGEERSVYEDRLSANSKDDFDLSVRLWDGGAEVPARAHLRGKGSLGCERRNYTLDLDTGQGRYLMPDSSTDEFYVLSMCLDTHYVRAYTVYALLGQFGLFPPEFRFIELRLDGVTRGVYLLMEKTKEAVVDDNSRVRSVLRRGFAPDATSVEVKYSATTTAAADADYHALVAEMSGLSGEDLSAAMDARLDTEGYLRLLAINSLLRNGDHVDEMWLTATEHLGQDGTIGGWYTVMGWDPDDVFRNCHYGGSYAYQDTYALSYCAEAELDDYILGDPVMYERYVDVLEEVLQDIDEVVFQTWLDHTADDLLYYIWKPGIAPAMVEMVQQNPATADPEVAEGEIRGVLDSLAVQFANRRLQLQGRVIDYRAQKP